MTFDEWRGGVGMTLPIARCIIEAHGGRVLSPAKSPAESAAASPAEAGKPSKTSAVIFLPAVRA